MLILQEQRCAMNEIVSVLDEASKIIVYKDGKNVEYFKNVDNYGKIYTAWKMMVEDSHQMPAFGVSIDADTKKAMNEGVWVEFVFDEVKSCCEMPFSKILVNVCADFGGFNLIRYDRGGYNGRCFYLNLAEKNMSEFYRTVLELFED